MGAPREEDEGRGDAWRFAAQACRFASLCLGLYLMILAVVANVALPAWVTTHTNLGIPQRSGAQARSYQDARAEHDLDILFMGSSHAREAFDPRFFDTIGLRTFNLGSSLQTPLNTEFLMSEYPALAPRLLVLEVFPWVFGQQPDESAALLAQELPLSFRLIRSIAATRSIIAWNALVARGLRIHGGFLEEGRFVNRGRGFITPGPGFQRGARGIPRASIDVVEAQFAALDRILRAQHRRGGRAVLVVQPIPLETRRNLLNYDAVSRHIAEVARAEGVPYLDFNDRMQLDPTMFYDSNHLTVAGAQAFMPVFAAEVGRLGLLDGLGSGAKPVVSPAGAR